MDTQNNTPVPTPLEVAVRDLCGKVDAYLKQGCLRSQLYHVNERVKALLDSFPEQPVEGLEDEIENYFGNIPDDTDKINIARHFAGWAWRASHAKTPYYFKLREIKTGKVFLAEWSDMAGEWYERGNGKAYQSGEVEIVKRDQKTPTP